MLNILAGALIGATNSSWLEVLLVSAIWSVAFCVYVTIIDRPNIQTTVAQFKARAHRLLFGSPVATFYAIEFVTALVTSLFVACVVFLGKRLFT